MFQLTSSLIIFSGIVFPLCVFSAFFEVGGRFVLYLPIITNKCISTVKIIFGQVHEISVLSSACT